jgi:hypothetical protein
MVPGNGIIVKADPRAASGASVADYTLGGYRTPEVTRPSSWTVTNMKVHDYSAAQSAVCCPAVCAVLHVNCVRMPIAYESCGPVAGSSTSGRAPIG